MAHDAHIAVGVVAQTGCELVQHRREVGLDVRAAHGKRDVAGDIQLQLVVSGLRDCNTCSARSLLHFTLLALHVLRPDVRAQCAHASPHDGASACAAARGRPDHRASQRSNARTRGRAALGIVKAGTTGGQNHRGGNAQKNVFAHEVLL